LIALDFYRDAPVAARYHPQVIEEIVQCVDERVYCAVLGPRLCGKTLLMRFIESHLAPLLGWTCVYIDLKKLRTSTQQAFFEDLIQVTGDGLQALTGTRFPLPTQEAASSSVYRGFLTDCLADLQHDLVLLLDPLEALPVDLVQALLTSLRAAYMDQQNLENQVTVVVSGSLSLATLTVGESSPFHGIARRVFVGDLSEDDSLALIEEILAGDGIGATGQAVHKLLQATRGDVYLIRWLSQRCVELVNARALGLLRARDVNLVTDRFLRREVFEYAPLVEAIRLIEEDPDLLECILRLLRQEQIARSLLPLPLSPDLDPLFLTGVVERVEREHYRLQNVIYQRFLSQYFTPGRVGHILAMAGRWDSAINYLEESIGEGNAQLQQDLLPAVINSMYAAPDLLQAARFMRRALSTAFHVHDAQIWLRPPQEKCLRLVGMREAAFENHQGGGREIELGADLLEARAYRYQVALRGQEALQRVVRAIPLRIPGRQPVGVVTVSESQDAEPNIDPRERDLQLVGFLNQAARALQTVGMRRQELALAGKVQASLLPEAPLHLPGWQVSAAWKPALETSGDFYDFIHLPGERLGIVIADVVDKGMGAALLMTLSRTLLRSYANDYPDQPAHLLEIVNRRILSDLDAGLFVTLFYGVLDLVSGELIYVNAGHPPPYRLTHSRKTRVVELGKSGLPLGVDPEATWKPQSLQLDQGDTLVCYTDGVLDAQNAQGAFFGETMLQDVIAALRSHPPQEVVEALMKHVFVFADGQPQVDDITLAVLRRE
jgi:hypothetical protein